MPMKKDSIYIENPNLPYRANKIPYMSPMHCKVKLNINAVKKNLAIDRGILEKKLTIKETPAAIITEPIALFISELTKKFCRDMLKPKAVLKMEEYQDISKNSPINIKATTTKLRLLNILSE